jgi:hypothetical protein
MDISVKESQNSNTCNCRWPRWRNDTYELVSTGVHRRRGYVGRLMICEVDAIHALIPSYRKMIHGVIWRQLEQQSEIISEVLCMNLSFASKSARPRLKMTIPSQSFAFFWVGVLVCPLWDIAIPKWDTYSLIYNDIHVTVYCTYNIIW